MVEAEQSLLATALRIKPVESPAPVAVANHAVGAGFAGTESVGCTHPADGRRRDIGISRPASGLAVLATTADVSRAKH